MAPMFNNIGTQASGSSGTITPGLPTGFILNDIHVMFVGQRAGDGLTIPGFVKLVNAFPSTSFYLTVAYRDHVTAGDTAPGITGMSNTITAQIAGYRYVDLSSAISVQGTPIATGSSVTITTGGITTLVNDEMVLMVGATRGGGTTSGYSGSPTPTERIDAHDAGNTDAIFLADFIVPTQGTATGNRTATNTVAGLNIGYQVSLKPGNNGMFLMF